MLTIHRPTLLLDEQQARTNIQQMAARAKRNGVRLRPHFKTHQSARIGAWFREFGVRAVTVSSVEMGLYFARHGWQDITIAFPVNILEIEAINRLAGAVRLGLLVESSRAIHFLAGHLSHPVDIWLKVDVGGGRTGLPWTAEERAVRLAEQIRAAPGLNWRGLLTHAGQIYGARSPAEVRTIHQEAMARLERIRRQIPPPVALSIGDTPACSLVEDLGQVDEIRPGNFVFYDLMQWQIGACRETDIAVAVACPVVAIHPDRLVIYGGAVHLSKEFIIVEDRPIYGYVALLEEDGWGPRLESAYVAALSQEHGLIRADEATLARFQIGDLVVILPVHSCLTVNLLREYLTLAGERYPCL